MSVVGVASLLSLVDGFLFAGQSNMLSTKPVFTLIEFFSINLAFFFLSNLKFIVIVNVILAFSY